MTRRSVPADGATGTDGRNGPTSVADREARDAAIRVRGLAKRYGDRIVLDEVAFDVAAGEVFALLGPNGAGKTTTVEILEGYRRADGGEVRVLGVDPIHGGRALRARIGLMLQGGGGVDMRARPGEVLRLYAALHADPRDPDELLDLVGLRAVARTPFRRLSGGERQRLGLAIALVGRPELVLLDEPTAGMDPGAKALTRELIRQLRRDGITVVLTTHDLTDVERLADRVAILHHGRIVAAGSPGELVADAAPRLTVRFATSVAAADGAALEAALAEAGTHGPRRPRVIRAADDPHALRVDGPEPTPALVAAVAAAAAARDRLIVELRTGGGTLEDRYLDLTGDRDVGGSGGHA